MEKEPNRCTGNSFESALDADELEQRESRPGGKTSNI